MPDDAAPHSFSIDCPTAAIQLDGTGRGTAVLTITNTSAVTIDGRLRLAGAGATPAVDVWLKITEAAEQRFKSNESRRFTVTIAVPPTQADGTFLFRAETYAVANPNEDFTCGPEMSITVKRAAAPVHKPFPIWILIVIAVVVLLIVGVIVVVSKSHKDAQPDPGTTTQTGEPNKDPGNTEPETKDPGSKEPGPKEPGPREPINIPPIKETWPGPKRTSEVEPLPTEVRAGTIAIQPGMGIDLETKHAVPGTQRAEMDLIYEAIANGHLLVALNGVHMAKTPNATEAECEAVLRNSTLVNMRLDGLKPSDLIACKSRQGGVYVVQLVKETSEPAGVVDLHVERATGLLIRPGVLRNTLLEKR